jgi:hypothetical protein
MRQRLQAAATRGMALIGLMLAMVAASPLPGLAAGPSCLPSGLKRTLAEVERRFGPVQVISGHRPGATIAGSGKTSYHASCRAVDFRVRNQSQAAAWLKANHYGGVGTYSGGHNHIHIDDGGRYSFHKGGGGGGKTYTSTKTTKKKSYS